MIEDLNKKIFRVIKDAEDHYKNISTLPSSSEPSEIKEESDKKVKESKHKREDMALSNLNYKFSEMKKQKEERDYLNNKQKKIEVISDYNEIDFDDSVNKSWIKLDNWQRKQKINQYCNKYPQNDQKKISQLISTLIRDKKITNRNIIYNKDLGKIEDIKSEILDNYIKNLMI